MHVAHIGRVEGIQADDTLDALMVLKDAASDQSPCRIVSFPQLCETMMDRSEVWYTVGPTSCMGV